MVWRAISEATRDLGRPAPPVSSETARGALTPTGPVPMIPPMFPRLPVSIAVVLALAFEVGAAAAREVLDKIVEAYEHQAFRLAVDLHVPEPRGQPAPSLDLKGWHHNDPNRPVLLRAGDDVEVTAVFNYGDKGVFLEISRLEKVKGEGTRAHLRVRFAAEALPDKPDVQATELGALIRRVLRPAAP